MKIASWNVNSINVRAGHVQQWLQSEDIDVLAIQEIKMTTEKFPYTIFTEMGYHCEVFGQKTYNGVCLLSKQPLTNVAIGIPDYNDPQARVITGMYQDTMIVNVYVPNGSSVGSEKYHYKLAWLTKLTEYISQQSKHHKKLVVLGDFNIAPEDIDVHDPQQWQDSILCSAPERQALAAIMNVGLVDSFRQFNPNLSQYSWWDYRQAAYRRNLGLRIDLILSSESLNTHCRNCYVDEQPRKWDRPSDHAPVVADLATLIRTEKVNYYEEIRSPKNGETKSDTIYRRI